MRRRQRSNPERVALAQMNSRVTASKSSSGSSRVRRSSTTTRACAGVRVVCRRWPVCEQSWKLVRFFHL